MRLAQHRSARRPVVIAVLAVALLCFLVGSVVSRADASSGASGPVVVNFDVPVDPGSSTLMADAVATAKSTGAPAIVIEMNTPGGYLSDMLDIVASIQQANQSGIPTYTYVPPDALAASAGSYIAMASNEILMGPGSEIGPSTPIVEGGTTLDQNHTEDAMLSLMVSLAQMWGRNATAAQAMVLSDIAYSAADANQYHLAEGNASTLQGALSQFGLGPSYTVVQEGVYDQLLSALSDPNLYGILILLGAIAIVLDLWHPTFVLSIGGAIALVAGLVGAEVVGSSLLGLAVILTGVVLMILELWQGHGFAMMGGAVVGALGVYLLFQGVQYSSSTLVDYTQVEAVVVGAVGVLGGLYIRWIVAPLRRRRSITGPEALVGKQAVAVSPTEVRVEGVIWRAKSLSGGLGQGDTVTVKAVEGLVLLVEKGAKGQTSSA
ncbi:MAG: nodulation protein NfeD [Thaumarchaeota archaeon]|nr:nodulation protein NfeD [Nitrososphaerota archaeon]